MHILDAMKTTDNLPHIVTTPGDYITRDGRRVTIHTVQDDASPYTFKAKGSIWRLFRGKQAPRGLQVWHKSGRLDMANEKPGDIIATWKD
ncbi:hypothetical protein [Enterobacter hormaechei]